MIQNLLLLFAIMTCFEGIGFAATDPQGWMDVPEDTNSTRAVFTADVVEGIVRSGKAELATVSDAEARLIARAQGIELGENYGRPWIIIKAGLGLPNLVNAHVEIFVTKNWTVEFGTGAGLLPSVFEGSIRWRPDATCWGCDGNNFLSVGFGIDPGVYTDNKTSGSTTGVMVTATVDVMYIHRVAKHFGIMIGSRAGVGFVTEFGASSSGTSGHVEPALKITLIEAGFVF